MRILRYGSRGMDVRLMQLALQRGGWYRYAPDGIFGTRTLNALRRFQTSEGLAPDGAAGPLTQAALEPWLLGYRQVKLRGGDSFYRLSRRYGTTTEAVRAANPGADPDNLPIGGTVTVPIGGTLTPDDVPMSSMLMGYIVRGLAARYPFIKTERIGSSALGEPLYALELGEGKAELGINAAHHANEWITSTLVIGFVERLLSAYVNGGSLGGADAHELFNAARLCVTPLVNPDGVDIVTGALAPGSVGYAKAAAIAEDYPGVPFPNG